MTSNPVIPTEVEGSGRAGLIIHRYSCMLRLARSLDRYRSNGMTMVKVEDVLETTSSTSLDRYRSNGMTRLDVTSNLPRGDKRERCYYALYPTPPRIPTLLADTL